VTGNSVCPVARPGCAEIGSQAMNARVYYYYNVEKPDIIGDSSIRPRLQFMFPK
jgi:hypothetical protein